MQPVRRFPIAALLLLVAAAAPVVEGGAAPNLALLRPNTAHAGSPGASAVAGPISVAASLNVATCPGGPVTLSANVSDTNGVGVQGATVTGHVQYKTTGHDFTFLATDASGNTATVIETGRPRGGYNVVFTVDATAGGSTAETQAACYAP